MKRTFDGMGNARLFVSFSASSHILLIFTSHCIGRSNTKELDDIFWWAKVQFSLYFFWESFILA
jgi:hypothetical protein